MMKKMLCLTLLVGVFAIINNLPSAAAFPQEEHILEKHEDEAPAPEPADGGEEASEGADGGEGGEEPEEEIATIAHDEEDPSSELPILLGEGEDPTEEPLA
uniref:FST1 protein n=2 Tax=Ceratitis capitata TaxID=7213 RepID=O96640_CERCA